MLLGLSRLTQVGLVVVGLDAIDVIYRVGFAWRKAMERQRHQAVHPTRFAYPIHPDPHSCVSSFDFLRYSVACHIEHMSMGRGRVARHPWDRTLFTSRRCNGAVRAYVDRETAGIRERLAAVGAVAYVRPYVSPLMPLDVARPSRRVFTADVITSVGADSIVCILVLFESIHTHRGEFTTVVRTDMLALEVCHSL